MVTGTWTLVPILTVISNGGKIEFSELIKKLVEYDSSRFRNENSVIQAMEYNSCLKIQGNKVVFNKNALKYASHSIHERHVQHVLHKSIPNMEKFQLYPYVTKENSPVCYVGVPW